MNFCEKLIKENAIEVEPVNEGAGLAIVIGTLAVEVATFFAMYKATDKAYKDFSKNNPHIKGLVTKLNGKCREAIKKEMGSGNILDDITDVNIKPTLVKFKPAYISNDILRIDYESICKSNGMSSKNYEVYSDDKSITLDKEDPNFKKAYDACNEVRKKLKEAVSSVSESIKSEKNGHLVTIELVDNNQADGEDDEYSHYFGNITVRVNIKVGAHVKDSDKKSVNEAADVSQDPPREEQKKALSDLEFSYDKKYNAFCLSVSGYSTEKLENMLQKKTEELKAAKEEKQKAPTRYSRMAAQIKIDYLVNVTNRCKAMIRKKKSYHKAEEKK